MRFQFWALKQFDRNGAFCKHLKFHTALRNTKNEKSPGHYGVKNY